MQRNPMVFAVKSLQICSIVTGTIVIGTNGVHPVFLLRYIWKAVTSRLNVIRVYVQRGVLPKTEMLQWPEEPFASQFAQTMSDLEMPRFCRRYPALLTTLMKQMLDMVQVGGCCPASMVAH